MEKSRILIIEDERRLADVLKKQIEESGLKAEVAYDGREGRKMFIEGKYHLIILDINLPYINGYDLCKEIRKTDENIPVIMLTAMGSADKKLTGFDVGADDYVVKPFEFKELLARISVFLKRSEIKSQEKVLSIADLEMHLDTKSVIRNGKKIDLTAKEFLLLETFIRNRDKVLSREFLSHHVWEMEFDSGTNIIDVYVNYLRKKMDKDFEPRLIHTKYGFGFYCSETEF